MSISIRIEPVNKDDVLLNAEGAPYALKLAAGEYALVDPELILDSNSWDEWRQVSYIESASNFGPGGVFFAAKINGYSISGMTTYSDSGEYSDDYGDLISTRSGIIAAVPTELLEDLIVEYARGSVIKVKKDSMITYSESSHNIYFGDATSIYTGYPEDADY